ncbi:MAG: class I SAM-dependent methyltransferase [Kordiimonadaceae bacterium]|nr:class I SAM-dependent methyltransferase [Kordiimonadaceae bacterium]
MSTKLKKISLFMLIAILPVLSQSANADQYEDLIKQAIENPARKESNRSRDPLRKPAEVVKFMGVKPGMTILDMYADGSYYTEILSFIVGEEGRVIAQMFPDAGRDPDNPTSTYIRTSNHLKNVVPIYSNINDLDFKENSLDQIFIIQFYHDFYYKGIDVDLDKIMATYHKALKPGSIIAIVDHEAIKGSPSSSGDTLHRIDPAIVKRNMESAGFIFEGEKDILLNDTDDKSISVFDDRVRGKTSRFIMKFKNP